MLPLSVTCTLHSVHVAAAHRVLLLLLLSVLSSPVL
jgi:hypothetical protein